MRSYECWSLKLFALLSRAPSKGFDTRMRKSARIALAAVVFMMAALFASARGGDGGNTAQAQVVRQPTPNLTKILESPSPVDDEDDEGGGGEDGGGSDGGGSGGDGGSG